MRFLLLLFIFSVSLAHGQSLRQADVVGTWVMLRMVQNSDTVIDRYDTAAMCRASIANLRKHRLTYTAQDSLDQMAAVRNMAPTISDIYMILGADGSFNTIMGSVKDGAPVTGTYKVNEKTRTITTTVKGRNEELAISLKNGVLIMSSDDIPGFSMQMQWTKK